MTIVYTNIGRNNGCKTIELSLSDCIGERLLETVANGAREFLVSNDISAFEYEKNKFKIYAGLQVVGTAEII